MSRRIERRNPRVGKGDYSDPKAIEELQERQEKHERLTRGKPSVSFSSVLKKRLSDGKEDEEEPEQEQAGPGARDPLLGLNPGQDAAIANHPKGLRSGKVIVKG